MQGLRTSWSGALGDPPFGAEGRAALRSFLADANHRLAAAGSALFWPRFDGAARWQAEYVGEEPEKVRRWLCSRLDSPLEELAGELANEAPRPAGATPRPVTL
jgi:hypothetical protein